MARLWTSGYELGTLTANLEWTTGNSVSGGCAIAIESTIVKSGTYSGKYTNTGVSGVGRSEMQFISTAAAGPWYARMYFRTASIPSSGSVAIIGFINIGGANYGSAIYLSTTGALRCSIGGNLIGTTAAGAIVANTWYRIELYEYYNSPDMIIQARLDGVEFANTPSATIGTAATVVSGLTVGNLSSITGYEYYIDDIAINDGTGSVQNSWCGEGKVIHLRPNAAGDVNTFATTTGGTAGLANNFTRVNEVIPDTGTTVNQASALNQEDMFESSNSGIGASDAVTLVQIGGSYADQSAGTDAVSALRLQLKKISGGTVLQSANLIPNSTTIATNSPSPRIYKLTAYTDPDGAAWTQTTLDTMQIGYKETAFNARHIRVSTLWALIEYIPATGGSFTLSTDLIDYTFGAPGSTTLVMQDAFHTHLADNIDLVQDYQLVVNDASHTHTVDNAPITSRQTLGVLDALHAHLADNIALTGKHGIQVQETLHGHTVDNVAVTERTASNATTFFPFFG